MRKGEHTASRDDKWEHPLIRQRRQRKSTASRATYTMQHDDGTLEKGYTSDILARLAERDQLLAACKLAHAERNALLATLKDLVEQVAQYANSEDADLPDTWRAEQAIAKAEKGTKPQTDEEFEKEWEARYHK
jgi:predicted GIY-YIG superfamily endonuclease